MAHPAKRETRHANVFTRRALLMMGGQVALLAGLSAKLYQVQIVQGGRYATLADENRISARLIAPPRGRMLDRFGVVLGGNKINWRALLIAEQTTDSAATLAAFSKIVPLSDYERARIEREIHRHRRFIPTLVREFLSWEEMAAIEVNAPTCRASWSMSAPPGCIRSTSSTPTWSATSRRRTRTTSRTTRCSPCPVSASAAPG